jgi:hypothetical protein
LLTLLNVTHFVSLNTANIGYLRSATYAFFIFDSLMNKLPP